MQTAKAKIISLQEATAATAATEAEKEVAPLYKLINGTDPVILGRMVRAVEKAACYIRDHKRYDFMAEPAAFAAVVMCIYVQDRTEAAKGIE